MSLSFRTTPSGQPVLLYLGEQAGLHYHHYTSGSKRLLSAAIVLLGLIIIIQGRKTRLEGCDLRILFNRRDGYVISVSRIKQPQYGCDGEFVSRFF